MNIINNKNQYNFDDFTHESYNKLLDEMVKKCYSFLSYDFLTLYSENNYILLRHDIDMSVHEALDLAKIEASKGIKATYFLLLHSEFYNLFEKEISDIVYQIIELGHNIGLHFDSHYYGIEKEEDLDEYLLFEKKILEKVFKVNISVFSFHNTNEFVLSCKKEKYAGMVNTYAAFFQDKTQIGYCSDSFGYWRYERLSEIIKDKKYNKLQILTHPEWWTKKVLAPKERIYRTIDGRQKKTTDKYHTFLTKYGYEPIGWE
jgi:hypothetical protein